MNWSDKLPSGRWILTVICGLVFVYGVYTDKIKQDQSVPLIVMVFVSYFQRNDRKNGNDLGNRK